MNENDFLNLYLYNNQILYYFTFNYIILLYYIKFKKKIKNTDKTNTVNIIY